VPPRATFFTVANERFFIGVACLVNSLRITGNDGELVILDSGLTRTQRRRLEPHARLTTPPADVLNEPMLLKPFPHALAPEGTVAMIDSDIIVTRSLDPLLAQAEAGKVCLFRDEDDRWFPEWERELDLMAPLRRQAYLNSGFIALSTSHLPDLLRRWWEACRRIPRHRMRGAGAGWGDPFWNSDQDAINALLMSEVDPDAVLELPVAESAAGTTLERVRVLDPRTLACVVDDLRPYLLHAWGEPKPWHGRAWMRVTRNAYVRLMPRVLLAPDVPVPVSSSELPLWLRPTRAGRASLAVLSAVNRATRAVLSRGPHGVKARFGRFVRREA
jgi:hypothetical protein